jgi:hypothetical protein
MRNLFYAAFLLMVYLVGCAKHADAPPPTPVTKRLFGAQQTDSAIDLSSAKPITNSTIFFLEQKRLVSTYSKDWLDLSNQLMEAGEAMPEVSGHKLSLLGHQLAQSFYRQTRAYTTMTGLTSPPGSPYAEVAEYYARPALKKKITELVDEAKKATYVAARRTKVVAPQINSDSKPSIIIDAVVEELKSFENELRAFNQVQIKSGFAANSIIEQIAQEIGIKYAKDLLDFRAATNIGAGQSVKNYMAVLRDHLSVLEELSQADRKKLSKEVERGRRVAELLESVSNSASALNFLTDLWTARALRWDFPPNAKSFFKTFTQSQLIALATNNKQQLAGASSWDAIKNTHNFGLLTPRDLVSVFTGNSHQLMSESDWQPLALKRKSAIENLVKQKDVRAFAEQITPGLIQDDEEAFISLIANWLSMSFRLSMPSEVKEQFSKYTDEEVMLLGEKTLSELTFGRHLILAGAHVGIIYKLDRFQASPNAANSKDGALARFKKLVNNNIVSATQARINFSLRPIMININKQIIDALEPFLNSQIENADTTATQAYRKYGRFYLGKKVFGVDGLEIIKGDDTSVRIAADNSKLLLKRLPLLEKNKIRFSYTNLKSGEPVYVKEDNHTSAEVIGIALSNLSHRLAGLQTFENIFPESQDAVALQYQAFNKLLALGGYSTTYGEVMPSLSVSTTPGHENDLLDMKHYDPGVSSFAMPDTVSLSSSYKLDAITKREANISVDGQMELLKGFVAMMRYSKPWMPSSFDIGLPRLRMEEDRTIEAFPKDSFFALSFGHASVILKNIQTKMLGLLLRDERFIEGRNVADFSTLDPVAATLSNYDPEHISHIVSSQGVAKAIIALSDFYTETIDIDRATTSPFNDAQIVDQIKAGRTKVHQLLAGLSVFVSRYLQQPDGGFGAAYDLDRKRIVGGTRLLSDQLIMQEALLKAGQVMNADFFLFRALDNFFFLNKNFWNPELGFYRTRENDDDRIFKLVNSTRLLKNLQSFKSLMQDFVAQSSALEISLHQVTRLESFLMSRYYAVGNDFEVGY